MKITKDVLKKIEETANSKNVETGGIYRQIEKWTAQGFVFAILIIAAAAFSVWKCFLGFSFYEDEPFYFTIPLRLLQGDALFVDEWHLSQLSGVLLVPFVFFFRLITGSTEYMYLTARITYAVLHIVVSVIIYSRLRKNGWLIVVGAVLYCVFVPFDVMTLSYNALGLDFVALSAVLLATKEENEKAIMPICGFLTALAVLCCPYYAAAFVLYTLAVIISFIRNKKSYQANDIFIVSNYLRFLPGVIIPGIAYTSYILFKASPDKIIKSIPHMLSDPEHPSYTLIDKLIRMFEKIITCCEGSGYVYALFAVLLLVILIDRNRYKRRFLYVGVASATAFMMLFVVYYYGLIIYNFHLVTFPVFFTGTVCYIFTKNKNRKFFVYLTLTGFIYAIAISNTSNQTRWVFYSGMIVSNLASYAYIAAFLNENRKKAGSFFSRLIRILSISGIIFTIAIQSGMQIYTRVNRVHHDDSTDSITNLNYIFDVGPAKGIHTSINNYDTYEKICKDLTYYKSKKPGKFLYLSYQKWPYSFLDNMENASYSAWMSGGIDRLYDYYELNPDKIPDYVYISKLSEYDKNVINTFISKGYSCIENDVSFKLEKE